MFKFSTWFLAFISFLIPLIIYTATTARTITAYGDSAEITAAAYNFAASHPPGYPLFILLGKAATWLPIGTVAFRVNLLASLLGALVIFLTFWIFRRLQFWPLSAFLASQVLAFSYSFWLYAIVAEVFVLNNLLAMILIFLTLLYFSNFEKTKRPAAKILYLMSFVYGLGLSNHQSIILLAPAIFYVILKTDKKIIFKKMPGLLLFFGLGLAPYLQLIYSAQISHYPAFGNLPNARRFIEYVTRADYGGLFSPGAQTAGPQTYWDLVKYYFGLFFNRFTPLAPFLAMFWAIRSLLDRGVENKFLAITFWIIAILFPIFSLRGNDISDLHVLGVAERLSQLSFLMLGIGAILGLRELISKINQSMRVLQFILLITAGLLVIFNFRTVDKSQYFLARNWALNILVKADDDSVILTSDDLTFSSLLYVVTAEKIKPTVRVISLGSLSNVWYQKEIKKAWMDLYDTDSTYEFDIVRNIIDHNAGKHSVYFVMLDDPYPVGFAANPHIFTPKGLLLAADPNATKEQIKGVFQHNLWQDYDLSGLNRYYADAFAALVKDNYPFRRQVNARVFQMAGCLDCAKGEFAAAIEMFGENPNFKREMETLQLPQEPREKSAKEYLEGAKSQVGSSQSKNSIHHAIWDLERARALEPNNEEVHGTLAELFEFAGAYKPAIKEYEAAFGINPKEDWHKRAESVRKKAPKEDLEIN